MAERALSGGDYAAQLRSAEELLAALRNRLHAYSAGTATPKYRGSSRKLFIFLSRSFPPRPLRAPLRRERSHLRLADLLR
jgi:hypothetical protein